ncbi:sensor histidine kinase [Paenibacillus aquistagni]|uniref:histidine kinase n=1 Tax=Paenibacillus aquistagni TaxID=1852522 RepID=A0A1X7LWX6_9BACL|nr:ATP-binding protein [Paenibacillus aquistagni]SMG58406.1 Signal transduction histidine kinase [Paenibacillus aquistagni]
MMRNRIGIKLGVLITTAFLIVLLSLGTMVYQVFSNFYHIEMKTEVSELTAHFVAMCEETNPTSEQMMSTLADFSNVSMFYVQADGQIGFHSGPHDPQDRSFIRTEDLALLFKGEAISLSHTDPSGEGYLVVAQPLKKDETIHAAIYVMASTKHLDESLHSIRKLLLLSGAGAFLLSLGITWIMAYMLSRPLLQMQQATKKIASGELETRVHVNSKDEVGYLAEAINDLGVELKRYRDNRQEFFANISHELRTPITYLKGYAKVLQDGMVDSEEEQQRYLEIIHQEALRIEHLVNDLFDLAKMEEGQIDLYKEWVNLEELLEEAMRRVELSAKDKGIALHLKVQADLPLVYADGMRLEQIVMNLLENAIRYTERGEIELSISHDDDEVAVRVKDSGIGIPQEELEEIFERFHRVEKSRSREHGGSGLGLSIVKKLVDLHDATIQVQSTLGIGTTFIVRLPREQ